MNRILTCLIVAAFRVTWALFNKASGVRNGRLQLCMNNGKSRMPVFDDNDKAELERIMSGEHYWEDMPDFSANLPPARQMQKKATPAPPATPTQAANQPQPKAKQSNTISPAPPSSSKKVIAPNADWRSAMSKPAATSTPTPSRPSATGKSGTSIPRGTTSTSSSKSNSKSSSNGYSDRASAPTRFDDDAFGDDDFSFDDLDYDDFEAAMREEENGGMNPGGGGSKSSYIPEGHDGLHSGEVISGDLWSLLLDPEGANFKFPKLHKEQLDTVVVYADPRRMTDEFKIILSQFNKLPLTSLQIGAAAINCDDANDHRKYVKKNALSCTLLCDPRKKFMDAAKCRTDGRIASALILLDVRTCKVLKIWYENDWDAFTTKDLIVEEVKLYRKNPVQYVQSQIGIR